MAVFVLQVFDLCLQNVPAMNSVVGVTHPKAKGVGLRCHVVVYVLSLWCNMWNVTVDEIGPVNGMK